MSGPFYYYNTLGNKVSTTVEISMCQQIGPQSFCRAASEEDQYGCKYREDSQNGATHCTYYRKDMNGACDSVWAHTVKDNPNRVNVSLEDKQKIAEAPDVPNFCKNVCLRRMACVLRMRGETDGCIHKPNHAT